MNCGYECYQVGGPWIAENPACPVHGAEAPQREWQGLTDEEAKKTFEAHNCTISADLAGILARAIEAKLKEKNT